MIHLASTSEIKKNTVLRWLSDKTLPIQMYKIPSLIEQPTEETVDSCILHRFSHIINKIGVIKGDDVVIIIENYINKRLKIDICKVALINASGFYSELSDPILIPDEWYEVWINNNDVTLGSLIHVKHPEIPSDNWMKFLVNYDREDQIFSALTKLEAYPLGKK